MGSSRFNRLRFPFSKATSRFWRTPLSKRSLVIASLCALYLFFALFGYSQHYQDKDKRRHTRRLYLLDNARPDTVDSHTSARIVLPTRPNVVYITLKSKRLKPAIIRGTIRPKLRRKVRRTQPTRSPFTQNKFGKNRRNVAPETLLGETLDVDYKSLNGAFGSRIDPGPDSRVSSIRIYSPKAPPWFSAGDVTAMRFLADAQVIRIKKMPQGDFPSLLMIEGEAVGNPLKASKLCRGQCGGIGSPLDNTEVFAFHLDRVLGLNRTLPAVSRKFGFLYGRSRNKMQTFHPTDCCCTACDLWPTHQSAWMPGMRPVQRLMVPLMVPFGPQGKIPDYIWSANLSHLSQACYCNFTVTSALW